MTTTQKIIEQELLRIEKKHGSITPSLVVEESTPKNAVLHHHFLWKDSEAAKKYREWQARQIISVVTFLHPQMENPVRVFHNVTLMGKDEQGTPESYHVYMRTIDILKNPEARNQLLERAHREASDFQIRYKSLIELDELISAMRRILPKIKEKLKK